LIVKPNGEEILRPYWDINFSGKLELSENEWLEKVRTALIEAVEKRLISDVPLGVFLSGGIDSGLITAIMARDLGRKVKTFSIGFAEGPNELPYAKMVADQYGTEHKTFTVKPDLIEIMPELVHHYEEPYADASALPTWYLAKMTRRHVTVALTGDGGDENFAGYERFLGMKMYNSLRSWPAKTILSYAAHLAYRLTGRKKAELAARLLNASRLGEFDAYLEIISYFKPEQKRSLYEKRLAQLIINARTENSAHKFFDAGARFDSLDRLLYTGLHTYLPDDLLVKADIAAMANSLEVRSPFLDYEFIELTAKMPSELKLRGFTKKYLLKKIAASYLPAACINRPKQGFTVPLDYWFRGQLHDYLKNTLLDKTFFAYGFRAETIKRLVGEHAKGKANRENELYTLLCLRLWLKQWFE
jgi:asparagine synthase (glutamine-hydrolysing)